MKIETTSSMGSLGTFTTSRQATDSEVMAYQMWGYAKTAFFGSLTAIIIVGAAWVMAFLLETWPK